MVLISVLDGELVASWSSSSSTWILRALRLVPNEDIVLLSNYSCSRVPPAIAAFEYKKDGDDELLLAAEG